MNVKDQITKHSYRKTRVPLSENSGFRQAHVSDAENG